MIEAFPEILSSPLGWRGVSNCPFKLRRMVAPFLSIGSSVTLVTPGGNGHNTLSRYNTSVAHSYSFPNIIGLLHLSGVLTRETKVYEMRIRDCSIDKFG